MMHGHTNIKFDMSIFRKTAEKIEALLKSHKNNGYFTGRGGCIYDNISLNYS